MGNIVSVTSDKDEKQFRITIPIAIVGFMKLKRQDKLEFILDEEKGVITLKRWDDGKKRNRSL